MNSSGSSGRRRSASMTDALRARPGRQERGADLLHPFAVHPEVLAAQARGGAEVDLLGLVVEDELDVVHEMEDRRAALRLEVVRLQPGVADDPGARVIA